MNNTYDMEIVKFTAGVPERLKDVIVSEEPLEIFLNGERKYFCMRMPGMDYELVAGLLYSEGIINSIDDIIDFTQTGEKMHFSLKQDVFPGVKKIFASSGSMSSDELVKPMTRSTGSIKPGTLIELQREFFKMQDVFEKTGGVHAAAFFTVGGELISFAEDVGRHNALDKCTGRALAEGRTGDIFLIVLSSRISFEMIRKSYRTGAAVVAGVSAATSAAVSAAEKSGVTLIGYLRGEKFNIYCHPERIKL